MTTTEPYGAKGCSCFSDDLRWWPNARCRFHGILADYTADRRETGTYRVVPEPSTPPPGPAGVSRKPGEEVIADMYAQATARPAPEPKPNDCEACAYYGECLDCEQAREEEEGLARTYANHTWIKRPKKREQGVLATVRRWFGRRGSTGSGFPR